MHIHQDHHLQLQDSYSVAELEAGVCFLLEPIVKFLLLVCHTVVIVCVLLQGEEGCYCHLMSSPGLTDMRCLLVGVHCPGIKDQCLHPSAPLQLVTDIKSMSEDDKFIFTILLWLFPLDFLYQSKQWLVECEHWSLARVEIFHYNPDHIHGEFDPSYSAGFSLRRVWAV